MQTVVNQHTPICRAMLGRWLASRFMEREYYPNQSARIRYKYQSFRLAARS